MNRALVIIGLAAAFTLVASPAIRRALIRYSEHSLPKPDYLAPKYVIGGRYVTKEEFNERTPA